MAKHGAGVAQAKVTVGIPINTGELRALRMLHKQGGGAGPVAHPVQGHTKQIMSLVALGQGHRLGVGTDKALLFGSQQHSQGCRTGVLHKA